MAGADSLPSNQYLAQPVMDWLRERADGSLAGAKYGEAVALIERLTRELAVQKGVNDLAYIPHRSLVESRDALQKRYEKVEAERDRLKGALDDIAHRSGCLAVTYQHMAVQALSGEPTESGAPRREAGDRAGPLVSRQLSDETNGWQPIETAPKGGKWVLLAWPAVTDAPFTGYCSEGVWHASTGDNWGDMQGPTHWMPLPAMPSEKADGDSILKQSPEPSYRPVPLPDGGVKLLALRNLWWSEDGPMNRNEELSYRLRRWIEANPQGGTISYPELMSDPKYAPPQTPV